MFYKKLSLMLSVALVVKKKQSKCSPKTIFRRTYEFSKIKKAPKQSTIIASLFEFFINILKIKRFFVKMTYVRYTHS